MIMKARGIGIGTTLGVDIDLRPRCKRCGKLPRGKMKQASYEYYKPYCSYHCQEWAPLDNAIRYIHENFRNGTHDDSERTP